MRSVVLCAATLLALSACSPEAPESMRPVVSDATGSLLVDRRDLIGPVKVFEYEGHEALWASVRRTHPEPDVVLDRICAANKRDGTAVTQREFGDCVSTKLTRRGPGWLHPFAITFCPPSTKPGAVLDCDGSGVVVVITGPEVAQLDVEAVGGAAAAVRELGRTSEFALFVAEFTGPPAAPVPSGIMGTQRFTHTARDSDGTVIERITLSQRDLAKETDESERPHVEDSTIVERYGRSVPNQFGGLYEDDGTLVALFTGNLDQHRAVLRDRLSGQQAWRVQRGDRTWREIKQANAAVRRALLDTRQHPDVTGVGIGMRDGQFVITVGIHPYDSNRADELKHITQPHPVVVTRMGPMVRLPHRSGTS